MVRNIAKSERRRDLRIIIKKPFVLELIYKKEGKLFSLWFKKHIRAENISVGGARIELPFLKKLQLNKIKEGKDKLVLIFKIPSLGKPLQVKGRISWLEKRNSSGKDMYLAGVSFEDIKENKRQDILNLLINMCIKDGCKIEE